MQSADQARNVCVRVSDTGTGIAAADLPHIFERFYRSSTIRRESGSGLGLAIARQLVLLHGGDIHAQSEPDKGTSVTVALPRLPA
jgi:two-component system sensor histidine kinase BaeS